MEFMKRHPTVFMGLGITILFLCFWLFRIEFLDMLDLKFYDLLMKLRDDSRHASEIVLVDIDDDSIEKLGRWPWTRSLLAEGITKINAGNPKIIGLNIILSEPEVSDGLKELIHLRETFSKKVLDKAGENGQVFLRALDEAQSKLDHDKRLADAIKESGKVVLPVFLKESRIDNFNFFFAKIC